MKNNTAPCSLDVCNTDACDAKISEYSERKLPNTYYEIDAPLIAAHHWPLTLINLAQSRGVETHKLLRGTGIFLEDISTQSRFITPHQSFQLINNIHKQLTSNDISFLLGHQLLTVSHTQSHAALAQTTNLQSALDVIIQHQATLMPLINVRLRYDSEQLTIYWQDACGAETAQLFLMETIATAISAYAQWRSGENLPWQFYFSHKRPEHVEQYQVNLGEQVQFNAHINAITIAREHLYTQWHAVNEATTRAIPSPLAFNSSLTENQQALSQQGFLTAVYSYLQYNIHHNPNLEQTAADFGMSSATFKRKLKKHHSHFQQQYDAARRDLVISWLGQGALTNEQIAQRLHFHDAANLRRAFKKWTGTLPSQLKSPY
jgi:AraC-like DNA-binding protein